MSFWKRFTIFLVIGILLCVTVGPAYVIAWGFIYTIILAVKSEINQMNTRQGREQIRQEIQQEKEIEEYWGVIDYDEKD